MSVINHSKLSRIDGHMGVYNITVKDSTLGDKSVAAVGFGTMYLENVKSYGEHLVNLRKDYGCAWFGDVVIKNCTWDIGSRIDKFLIDITYDPTIEYGYDKIVKNGKTYYSQLPNNIIIDGLTIDATGLDAGGGYGFHNRGLNLFTKIICDTKTDDPKVKYWVDETYLSNPMPPNPTFEKYMQDKADKLNVVELYGCPYYFPIKAPETITVHNIHVINNAALSTKRLSGIYMRNRTPAYNFNDHYFFDKEYDKPYFNVEAVDANGKPLFDYSKEVTYETAD